MDALIVGAGGSGFLHALALRSAGVRIAQVYDPHRERAAWLADLCAAEVAPSLDAMSASVEIAAICSPPAFHVDQASALARPGRITFIEKPVAVNGDELERLLESPGVVPVVQWRAGRSAHQLQAAFAAKTFGPKPRIVCDFRLWRDREYWKGRANDEWPCGAMLSIGIHAVDLLLWVVGRPATQTSFSDTRTRGELELQFDDGTTAHIRIALDVHGRNEFRLRVIGANAAAELLATEEDPTALPMRWHGAEPPYVTAGATGSPLLVPYLHEALKGRAPSIADVAAAHRFSAASRGELERDSAQDRARAMLSLRRAWM